MVDKPPGIVESLIHIVLTALLGNVLVAALLPLLLAARPKEFREFPLGGVFAVVGISLLVALTARVLTVLQRVYLDYRRILTQGFIAAGLVALTGYGLVERWRLDRALLNHFIRSRGWQTMKPVIDYVLIPLPLCFAACLVVAWYTRFRIRSTHAWRLVFAVVCGGVLFLLSVMWARFSYGYLYPQHIGPWVVQRFGWASTAVRVLATFGFFPLSISIFTKLLLSASRHSSGVG